MSHWLDDAVADLSTLSGEPALDRLIDRCLDRLRARDPDLARLLRHPASTPFVALVDAVGADLAAPPAAVAALGRATVWLYLYVRVQDDLVDEPRRVHRSMVYAQEWLLARHLELFAAAAPGALPDRSALMRRFAAVGAREAALRAQGAAPEGEAWMGEKFLPMAVPLVGLAHVAARPGLGRTLEEVVVRFGTGLQLVNDVLNVREDHAAGRPTPVLRALDQAGACLGDELLAARLLAHPTLPALLERARGEMAAAADLAEAAGLRATAAVVWRSVQMAEQAPRRLMGLVLGVAA